MGGVKMGVFYVYELLDPRKENQPFYVGKGKGDRDRSHLKETAETTCNIHKFHKIQAILAAGLEVGIHRVVENLDEDTAYELEADLIQKYGRIKYDVAGILTNVCIDQRPPSALGRKHSDETRLKMSGPCPSKGNKGQRNGFYGQTHTDEVKAKLSLKAKMQWTGIVKPQSQRDKLKAGFTQDRREHARRLAKKNLSSEKFKEASRQSTIRRNKERSKAKLQSNLVAYKLAIRLLNQGDPISFCAKESGLTYGDVWRIRERLDYFKDLLEELYDQ